MKENPNDSAAAVVEGLKSLTGSSNSSRVNDLLNSVEKLCYCITMDHPYMDGRELFTMDRKMY